MIETKEKTLKKRVNEINERNRKEIWLQITGASALMQDQPNYFDYLCKLPRDLNHIGIKQISKDVFRTFLGDKSFDKESLKRILECYSLRNPNIGYCQGLNMIAAFLLIVGFTDCEAFWVFVQIIEHYTPTNYYNSMSGVILDQKVFDQILAHKLPKVTSQLARLGIESCLFTVQWFICMCSFNFTKEVVCLIWDYIFTYGHNIIFSIGISAISVIKDTISVQRDFVIALSAIEQECKNINFSQMKSAMKVNRIPWKTIKRLRDLNEGIVVEDFVNRFPRVYTQEELFESIGETCQEEGECKQKILRTAGYFTFGNGLNEIDGYLDLCTYPKYINYPDFFHDKHILGKKNHCCKHEEGVEEEIKLEEVIEEPLEFIKKSSLIGSMKRSFMLDDSFFKND